MITTQPKSKKVSEDDTKHIHLNETKREALASTLAEIRQKQKEHLVAEDAHQHGQRYVDLKTFPISNEALQLLDRNFCERERVVCFFFEQEQLRLGAIDPANPTILQKAKELEENQLAEAAVYHISEESLQFALKKYDAIPKIIAPHEEGIAVTEERLKEQQQKFKTIQELGKVIATTPITDVVALIIGSSLKAGASDIHIEAEAEDIKVRFRIDGVLHDIGILPKEAWERIISRIKLVAGLKINVTNKPQDGRFTILFENDKTEVRTSTVPTSYGESVVMRLLRFSVEALVFEKLGLVGYTRIRLEEEVTKPNGMIIATGPTGCGKTTTLYAILHKLNKPEIKILTLEDPVEYKLKGVNQTQINPQEGLDFARGLRSILRQDPDIIMVGEVRDLETADTAINAALTGHLMLSTLHTNSAAGAIPRFLAMGSKKYLLAPAINAIIGQRLVRLLCPACKKPEKPKEAILSRIYKALESIQERTDLDVDVNLKNRAAYTFYTGTGCDQCNGLGYRGRTGIFEILTMNKELEQIILTGNVSEYQVQETAQTHGMVTMLQDGILKSLRGLTSISEVLRQTD